MKIVTVNGCFDGLHCGHLFMLGYARGQGDKLVIGINSDEYIMRKKGAVIVPLKERVEALERLGIASRILPFSEDNPIAFLEEVMPHIHCTGAEYLQKCAEAQFCYDHGIKMVYVPRVGSWSSSIERKKLIEKEK